MYKLFYFIFWFLANISLHKIRDSEIIKDSFKESEVYKDSSNLVLEIPH